MSGTNSLIVTLPFIGTREQQTRSERQLRLKLPLRLTLFHFP
jgi:hypothetical protein